MEPSAGHGKNNSANIRPTRAVGSSGEAMSENITRLLHGWRDGDAAARDRLLSDVYDTLRDMASARRR